MSDLETIGKAMAQLQIGSSMTVAAAVASLAGVPAPKGNTETIDQLSDGYGKAAGPTDLAALDVANASARELPEVWVGRTANVAGDVVVAVAEDVELAAAVFGRARTILATLAEGITTAKQSHTDAQDPLRRAIEACDDSDWMTAKSYGTSAAELLLSAITKAETAGTDAARDLRALTAQARAAVMDSGNLSDSDRMVLAETSTGDGAQGKNIILTTDAADRAAARLDQMSDTDRQKVTELLANAKSPQERAYLMKTLAAGHSADELTQFANTIHPYGDDTTWLREHLTPFTNSDSTIFGQLPGWQLDPGRISHLCRLVDGDGSGNDRSLVHPDADHRNNPSDPASTSKDAFLSRLRDEQATLYDHGRDEGSIIGDIGQFFGKEGMQTDEGEFIADEQIGAYTGKDYQHVELDDTQSRRDILDDIYSAVDNGSPVPFQARDSDGGHQMMVIGHDGDRIQVYNPWGVVSWISADDFVNGKIDNLPTDGKGKVPNQLEGVTLPR
ncbi:MULTISPECIES: hypothetical protein [unclassified Nocardia]|uniref:hypothetical protein n=1 Tax=unclassified Nocardia TaxID=2637762 RepID=UPI0033A25C61